MCVWGGGARFSGGRAPPLTPSQTSSNPDSSRFGTHVELAYEGGTLAGATVATYFLEKARVVRQSPGERNFHVFYQLIAGADEAERRVLGVHGVPASFQYLTSPEGADTRTPFSQYKHLKNTMSATNLSPDEQLRALRVVAACAYWGNVDFCEQQTTGTQLDPASTTDLQRLGELLELSPDDIVRVTTTRTLSSRDESHTVSVSPERARAARDAIAKATYGRLFDWAVRRVNESLASTSSPPATTIGIVDLFGYEVVGQAGFAQLLINYADELVTSTFRDYLEGEQAAHRAELEAEWTEVELFSDNRETRGLIDGRPNGLISMLDQQCVFPSGNDEHFAARVYEQVGEGKRGVVRQIQPSV